MAELIFVTGNSDKFHIAEQILAEHGIAIRQASLEIDEVQSEEIEYIARKKAEAAFEILQEPLIVRDDAWSFPALRGFPGPYIKSINHWFTEEDFLRLFHGIEDRRAILTQTLVFTDGVISQVFMHQTTAYVLEEARGNSPVPFENITTIEGDNGETISEVMAAGAQHSTRAPASAWHEFIGWYKERAR